MKKLLFLFMLTGVALQLKAQSGMQVQPFNKLEPDAFYKRYLFKSPDSLKSIIPQYQQLTASNFKINTSAVSHSAYDHMPIIKMEGNSKMPVIHLDINSKMPVINLDGPNRILQLKTPPKP